MKTLAIDIDGVIRNINSKIEQYLEDDYPDRLSTFLANKDTTYLSLDEAFPSKEEVMQWLYQERPFEIFATAPRVHPKIIDDLNIFALTAKQQGWRTIIASVQQQRSITSTLHWLAKFGCKVESYAFFDTMKEKIDANFDVYLDDCPMVLEAFPEDRVIKVPYGFNDHVKCPTLDIAKGEFDNLYEILGVERVLKQ